MSLGFCRVQWMIACAAVCLAGRAAAQPAAPAAPTEPQPAASAQGSGGAQPTSPAPQAEQGPAALAALPKVQPSPEAIEHARSAYASGQEAFARGDYAAAQAAFQDAYGYVANPIVLLSIAESALKRGLVETALAAYDAYLRARPNAPDGEEVAQKRAALAQTQAPARLTLASDPPGADVIVDGQLINRVTPVTLELRPGPHRVSLVRTGYDTARISVQLVSSEHDTRSIELHASAQGPRAKAAAQPVGPRVEAEASPTTSITSGPARAAILVTSSLGAAGILAGTVLGIFALKERGDYNNQPTQARADRGERLALFADVGFAIGAMSLITTGVLLWTHDKPERADSARLQLIPSFGASGAAATAKVRF